MTFIDSHSHLYLEEFSADLPQVIERAKLAGVSRVLLPNIDSSTIKDMLRVADAYPGYCYPMIGVHPTSIKESFEEELQRVEDELSSGRSYIAIGEIGLDLYWDKTFLKEQLIAFDKQIQLALKYHLPVAIHSRDAFDELYAALLPYKDTELKGVFHSFTGSEAEVLKLLAFEGFMLGINGVVTFKNSTLWQVLSAVPLTRLLLETDAPYLTPVPYRGKRNESAYLRYTLHKLSEVYQKSIEEVARATTENTVRVFGEGVSKV
ncbi:TatD family hydrolase [Bacteroides sp. 224]|uniref:TatD family hydrolase n=1 Tax=Bacteroides sp. 224 TaxID=2302936 RepID=UPI0013D709CD|nr:TatD family hydrolase [Bacteroides sp. 224]NDV65617.1 TatD family deoxyribonuclease [Bacteroides sp. 224]